MSGESIDLSEFDLALNELFGRRGRGRPANGPALSYAARGKITSKFYRLRAIHSSTFLKTNSNQLFNCGRRKLKDTLRYHGEQIREDFAENSYEISCENDL